MNRFVRLYPWTLKHHAVADLTIRARLAYIELLADSAAYPNELTDKWLQRHARKDHRDSLTAAGLIIANSNGTYSVIQPAGLYDELAANTPQAV